MQPSLRRQLLLWLLLPLVALLVVNAWFGYRTALATASEAYDRLLLASVRAIADRIGVDNGEITVDLPYVALQLFESDIQERIYYRVSTGSGRTITGYADLPPPRALEPDRPVFYEATYNGEAIYLAALAKRVYDAEGDDRVIVAVGETSEARLRLSRAILRSELERQGLLVAAAALLVALGLARGLAPLRRLSEAIGRRAPTDLTPIDDRPAQKEVRPLIRAINLQLARVRKLLAARERFVADASHQVRTPLTVLKTQVEYGLRQELAPPARDLLRELHQTIEQTARLVNQLLALVRAEPDAAPNLEFGPVDLPALARETAIEWVPVAQRKRVDLGYEGAESGVDVRANRLLLHDLLANLIDNAIRYSPAGAVVTVRVRRDGDDALLEVEDSGPGIPETERAHVFERFFRGRGSGVDGSGLGLAIVKDVCASHGADVGLDTPASGAGLLVRVRFAGRPRA